MGACILHIGPIWLWCADSPGQGLVPRRTTTWQSGRCCRFAEDSRHHTCRPSAPNQIWVTHLQVLNSRGVGYQNFKTDSALSWIPEPVSVLAAILGSPWPCAVVLSDIE